MKLGLLADIHEHAHQLHEAIKILKAHRVDQFLVLGDIFDHGKEIQETVAQLREVNAIGIWGNHDCGFCLEPSDHVRKRYQGDVFDFMSRLHPRLEIDGCLFCHVEPWLDPFNIMDLWYFDGPPDTPEKITKSLAAVPHRIIFLGHFHRWLLGTAAGISDWNGEAPTILDKDGKHLVVIHAVWAGHCAVFDTKTNLLIPLKIP